MFHGSRRQRAATQRLPAMASSMNTSSAIDFFKGVSSRLADYYKPWGRCLAIVDHNIYDMHAENIESYFKSHEIATKLVKMEVTEKRKDLDKLSEICECFSDFGIIRREPPLVIGGRAHHGRR